MQDIKLIKEKFSQSLFGKSYNDVSRLLHEVQQAYDRKVIKKTKAFSTLMEVYSALSSNKVSVLSVLKKYEGQNLSLQLDEVIKEGGYTTFALLKRDIYKFPESDVDENLQQAEDDPIIYNIGKRKVNLFINCAWLKRDVSLSKKEMEDVVLKFVNPRGYRKIKADFRSLSYISNHDIHPFRDVNDFVTFIYPNNIPTEYLITISRDDAFLDFYDKKPASRRTPFMGNSQTLLDSTNGFNEVAVLKSNPSAENSIEVKPVAILCVDKITETERRLAKELNLSIVYSESRYQYKQYEKVKYDKNGKPKRKQDDLDEEIMLYDIEENDM